MSNDLEVYGGFDLDSSRARLTALKARHNMLVEARSVLTTGVDYGVIPGTGDKPTLLKPGAEKLAFLFGLRPHFETVSQVEDWEGGLFYYRYRCTLTSGNGEFVASAEGSCNTRESKYRYRNSERTCPNCGKATILKSKPREGDTRPQGWFCWAKKGGCGATFTANDPAIVGQEIGKVENTEPFELVNTVQKMAQKRALVAAVLIATGASQFYTQDVEDLRVVVIDGDVIERDTEPVTTTMPRTPQQVTPPTVTRPTPPPPTQAAAALLGEPMDYHDVTTKKGARMGDLNQQQLEYIVDTLGAAETLIPADARRLEAARALLAELASKTTEAPDVTA